MVREVDRELEALTVAVHEDRGRAGDPRVGLEERVVPHVRQALDTELPVDIELRPGRAGRSGRGLA